MNGENVVNLIVTAPPLACASAEVVVSQRIPQNMMP
jgi:hypothetical protein